MKKNTFALKGQKGVTLIELTVVIAVILVLISVLFIGATYYKEAADRSACVINLSAIEKAYDATVNIEGGTTPPTYDDLIGTGGALNEDVPECPSGGTYSISGTSASCTFGNGHVLN